MRALVIALMLTAALPFSPTPAAAQAPSPVKLDLNPVNYSDPAAADRFNHTSIGGTFYVSGQASDGPRRLWAVTGSETSVVGMDVGLADVYRLFAAGSTLYFLASSTAQSTHGLWSYSIDGELRRLLDATDAYQNPVDLRGQLIVGSDVGLLRLEGDHFVSIDATPVRRTAVSLDGLSMYYSTTEGLYRFDGTSSEQVVAPSPDLFVVTEAGVSWQTPEGVSFYDASTSGTAFLPLPRGNFWIKGVGAAGGVFVTAADGPDHRPFFCTPLACQIVQAQDGGTVTGYPLEWAVAGDHAYFSTCCAIDPTPAPNPCPFPPCEGEGPFGQAVPNELWAVRISDLAAARVAMPGGVPSEATALTDVAGSLFLKATDGSGSALWQVTDVRARPFATNSEGDSDPQLLGVIGSRLYFASTEPSDRDLWYLDVDAIAPPVPSGDASQEVTGGETVTTDPQGTGPSIEVPVQTTVQVPDGLTGTLTIDLTPATTPVESGYSLFGSQVRLEGPAATIAAPYVVTFAIDASALSGPDGPVAPSDVQVFRDGTPVADCTDPTMAVPDPCVEARTALAGGDASVTVRTSHFSTWNLGRLAYDVDGFFQPVDNLPTVNKAKAGSTIPVKFSLGGNYGLDVFQNSAPTSRVSDCGAGQADAIEELTSASAAGLAYNATSDRYTYTWTSDKRWTGCRTLLLRFRDGSTLTSAFHFS